MNCHEFQELGRAYLDGTLAPSLREHCDTHLRTCRDCQNELAAMDGLRTRLAQLPKEAAPSRDLWDGIRAQLESPEILADRPAFPRAIPRRSWLRPVVFTIPAMAAAAALALLFWPSRESAASWPVAIVAGTPRIGAHAAAAEARLRRGDWLETDAQSSAKVSVGSIGEVNVEPNSRLRLVETTPTEHRLELARGTMRALIWAPPRLFFVDTPAATAVDLGCAYTLSVDDEKRGVLHVTTGYVALENSHRQAIVPAGMQCITMPALGPGTPFSEEASPRLRAALERFDFGNGGRSALTDVLAEARSTDAITVWHLLSRANPRDRDIVYDKLTSLQPAPEGVTRAGAIQGDKAMLTRWASVVGLPTHLIK